MYITFAINTWRHAKFTTFLNKLFVFSLLKKHIFFQDSFYLTSVSSNLSMSFSARLENPQQEPWWRTVWHLCYALSTLPSSPSLNFPFIRTEHICSPTLLPSPCGPLYIIFLSCIRSLICAATSLTRSLPNTPSVSLVQQNSHGKSAVNYWNTIFCSVSPALQNGMRTRNFCSNFSTGCCIVLNLILWALGVLKLPLKYLGRYKPSL